MGVCVCVCVCVFGEGGIHSLDSKFTKYKMVVTGVSLPLGPKPPSSSTPQAGRIHKQAHAYLFCPFSAHGTKLHILFRTLFSPRCNTNQEITAYQSVQSFLFLRLLLNI